MVQGVKEEGKRVVRPPLQAITEVLEVLICTGHNGEEEEEEV